MTKLQDKPAQAAPGPRPASRTTAPLRLHVLGAIFRRDFLGYFSNPAGYVFIALFVLVCSWAEFWQPAFFANNLDNLAPLNQWMPYILLFFIPAITMSTWAEERRQGTEELLLTLPARDVEVVLGKYFAALGIFTVAILCLIDGHFPILKYLGDPDLGVLAANYLGFWLCGAMLIAVGMVASILSGNATVAFIIGAMLCAIPTFASLFGSPTAGPTRRFIEGLSVAEQFRDFGEGVIPLSSVFYFGSLATGMLYVNMVLLGRRHWAGGQQSAGRWGHATIRVAAVVLALVSLDVIVQKTFGSWRADLTEEKIHTLSPTSARLIREISADKPVFIQAYISPEVPREFVQTRIDLIDTLKEFAALGGSKIRLNIVETVRYSTAARDAEKRFGIVARGVRTTDQAKQASREIFLGVAFNSGLEEVVVPFFDRGLPIEYEVARSIRVVSGSKRKKVGILDTDARLLGGLDFQTMGRTNEWEIVTELKKQYDVTQVSADAPIPKDLDALVVAQPSSLAQRQIDQLTTFVKAGGATLLLLDPLPFYDPDMAARAPRQPPRGMPGAPPPEPKGNLKPLLDMLGIEWADDLVVWNHHNPHKQYEFQPEFVFIGRDAATDAFGDDPVTRGLQEVVFLGGGTLAPLPGAKTDFIPLLRTDDLGGTIPYDQIFSRSLISMVRNRPHVPSLQSHVMAARVTGPLPAEANPEPGKAQAAKPAKANVIAVADLEFISDQMFELRKRPAEELDEFDFDNVSFMLNCVDSLAGDDSFLPLRSRRAKHRTLSTVEEQARKYIKQEEEDTKAADADAKAETAEAQKRLDKQVEEVLANKELDERTKEATLNYRQAVENRKLQVIKAGIDDRRARRKEDARAAREEGVQRIQNGIRVLALLWPPSPVLLLGGIVFFARARGENRGANPNRLA